MGKTILITGCRGGIGRDAAVALAKRGHRVVATTHTTEQAGHLRDFIRRQGIKIEVFKLDITQSADCAKGAKFRPDVLINNAAIGESGPLSEIPFERVEGIVETNVLGTLKITQHVLKLMLARKRGRIITLSSVAGHIVIPFLGAYNMTKFALEAAFDALRMELKGYGIQISLIEPGLIYTTFNERMDATKYEWLTSKSVFASEIPIMRAKDAKITPNSYPTTSVVRAIVHAVEARRPKARYVRPRSYRRNVWLSHVLPDGVKDFLLRRYVGL